MFNNLVVPRGIENRNETTMGIQDYLDLLAVDKRNKHCRVVTAAEVYDGVYLRSKCLDKDLVIVIRPTGKTREELSHLTCAENPQCDPSKEVAIRLETIMRIDFES